MGVVHGDGTSIGEDPIPSGLVDIVVGEIRMGKGTEESVVRVVDFRVAVGGTITDVEPLGCVVYIGVPDF